MSAPGLTIIFMISWWIVFLMVLPIGVRGQFEDDDVAEGTEPGAPVRAGLARKALYALIGAALITIVSAILQLTVDFEPTL